MGFYLGKTSDGAHVDYPAKNLTTHGLIFGMTGSGKTGLAIGLLEEAQRSGVPIIAIDPKGDLANLALAWPDLAPARFAEWLDPGKLAGGAAASELGQKASDQWTAGLAADGLGPADIQAMRARSALAVYTPGSTAGIPVSLLSELAPPPDWDTLADEDRSELVSGLVSALLALVDVPADPLQSKEAILVSTIVLDAWSRHETLDLAQLVKRVDNPPIKELGVFKLDEFLSPKKRKDLALQLNALVAAPAFQAWRTGEPLDVEAMLKKDSRGVRTSIFSIAHLDDAQRLSFVTLLLDRVVAWMRAQSGTGDLRAILYMDEVFGYLPPHPANPPTKRPLMTLFKQARAFGLGVVLATQNPVDVDYKALTNAGTWLIGKLQTDQDKDRVLDGLMSAGTASQAVSRSDMSNRISALEPRQFVLQDANAAGPVTFKSRFAMSYLRGPMTRQEIERLAAAGFYNLPAMIDLAPKKPARVARPAPSAPAGSASGSGFGETVELGPPSAPPTRPSITPTVEAGWPTDDGAPLVPGLEARFLPSSALRNPDTRALFGMSTLAADGPTLYRPALYAEAYVRYTLPSAGHIGESLDGGVVKRVIQPLPPTASAVGAWRAAEVALDRVILEVQPALPATFAPAPGWLWSPAETNRVKDIFVRELVKTQHVRVPASRAYGRFGQPGESIEDFRARLLPHAGQQMSGELAAATASRERTQATFKKKLDDMRELLQADQRELGFLRERGDTDGIAKASIRAKLRIENYKALQKQRDVFVEEETRAVADVEFRAMDKVESLSYEDLTLEPRNIQLVTFGLVWVPNR